MQQIEVDGQSIEGGEARLAIGRDGPGAAVRDPADAGAPHPSLGDDARALLHAAVAQHLGEQSLVVTELGIVAPVRVGGVKDGHPGIQRRCDGCQ